MGNAHYSREPITMLLLLITMTENQNMPLRKDKYIITGNNIERVYDPRFLTLFPRMWSDQSDHIEAYQEWGGIKGVSDSGYRSGW